MKRFVVLALVLLSTLVLAQQHSKKKPTVSAVFDNARYVWVESMDGDVYTPTLLPEDRRAIIDVQNAIVKWGRYVLTADRRYADLIFVVPTGRAAEIRVGASAGNTGTVSPNPNQRPRPDETGNRSADEMGTAVMVGGGVGPPNDLLKVVMGNDAQHGAQLWLRSEKDGLDSPGVPLFKQLRQAVDHDFPQ